MQLSYSMQSQVLDSSHKAFRKKTKFLSSLSFQTKQLKHAGMQLQPQGDRLKFRILQSMHPYKKSLSPSMAGTICFCPDISIKQYCLYHLTLIVILKPGNT